MIRYGLYLALAVAASASTVARAEVDPACADLPRPADYDEQVQQDFLANYVALSAAYSGIHAPVPHAPGHGSVGVRLAGIPPLGCERRYVLDWTKTEETNKTPVLPQIEARAAFPALGGRWVPYLSVAYLPPVPLLGTQTVALSGAGGLGTALGEHASLGLRFHATVIRVVADVATAFDPADPAVDDLYLASVFGLDLLAGWQVGPITPYLALGFTDVSTFFWIGDNGVVTDNYHPYAGPSASLGADALLAGRWRLGAEAHADPGGFHEMDPARTVDGAWGRYGRLYTARLRLALEL